MSTVIKVENISKQYRLGDVGTGAIKDDIKRWRYKMMGKPDPFLMVGVENDRTVSGTEDYVWALRDINFEVKQGEVLGIIGRNGAGKSTLLKILSRTTTPTTGQIKIKGRIASLLEVGTGFHPELSGRENIFLNGAILGMTKTEIRSKFDEIVDFAGVEKYIDTPVKRYSSGMYVRLAFGVAAHLEPEILIVDEVLAVGDAEFQKKALGKMKDVSVNGGRTVLFVSHNMAAVKSLCSKCIVLQNGTIKFSGSQPEAIQYYQKQNNSLDSYSFKGTDIRLALGNENIRITDFCVESLDKKTITISTGFTFCLRFYSARSSINLDATFELRTLDDLTVFHHGAILSQNKDSLSGFYKVTGRIEPYIINAGSYKFSLIFGESQRYVLFEIEDIIQFDIANENIGTNYHTLPGILRPNILYTVETEINVD